MNNMKEMALGFLDTMKADGKSKCTIEAYRNDLQEFCEFFSEKTLSDIKYPCLKSWTNHLESMGVSASTRARKVSSIKSFFRYLVRMGEITQNPAESLESPKIEKRQPVVITSEQAADLLFHARNDANNELFWFRDYAIMAIFLYTGVRREELSNIKVSDVDLQQGFILIHGKGNKQRKVYISETLHKILSEYMGHYRHNLTKSASSNFLFPSRSSDKLSLGAINNIVNRFMENAGIKKSGMSAHVLRKRFATSVFENTHDIATVSKLLGHSSPTVTTRYIVHNEDSMRKATECVSF